MERTDASPFDLIKGRIIDTDARFFAVSVNGELARDLLACYNREPKRGEAGTNRKASPRRIRRYRDDMVAGDWVDLSPQPIIFSERNAQGKWEQIDGQQRLKALVEASLANPDIEVVFWVCVDAPLDAKVVLDLVRPRTAANYLQMNGEVNAGPLSSAARLLYCYKEVPYASGEAWKDIRWSNQQQAALLEKHPGIRQGLTEAQALKSVVSPYIGAVTWYLIAQEYDAFVAADFINGLEVGANLDVNDARLKFRNFLTRAALTHRKWEGYELFALMIKAFNSWLLKNDEFKPSFRRNETFPRLVTKERYLELKQTYLPMDIK